MLSRRCNSSRLFAASTLSVLSFAAHAAGEPQLVPPTCGSEYERGVLSLHQRDLKLAVKTLNEASLCDPKMVAARLALGEAYAAAGEEVKALRAYGQALEIEPKNPAALRGSASIYLKNDNNEKAIPLLVALTGVEPSDVQGHVDLGAAYAAGGNRDLAQKEFESALRLEPHNASALTGLGNFLEKEGDLVQAIALAKRAIAAAPNAFEPYFVLGSAYSKQQNYTEARKALETAIRLGGRESPEVYYQLARVYGSLELNAERGQALSRFAELTKSARDGRENQNAIYSLLEQSRSLVNSGDLAGAIALLKKALELQPADDQVLFRLAGLHYDLKDYDQARVLIDEAIGIAPTMWVYHYLRGLVAASGGRSREAQESLETAARLNPAAAEVRQALKDLAAQNTTRQAR